MQKKREGNSIWDVLPEKQQPANMAGKQLHKSITRGRCVHDTVHDSFKGRFLPQFLPLWGSTCFDCYFFFPSIFGGLWHCPEKFQTYLEGRKKRSKRERKQVKRNKHSLDFLSHLEKSHEPWSLNKCLFFVPRPSRHWGIHFHSGEKNRAGNIQFTRRQRRWFHWQYNNMLHGA